MYDIGVNPKHASEKDDKWSVPNTFLVSIFLMNFTHFQVGVNQ